MRDKFHMSYMNKARLLINMDKAGDIKFQCAGHPAASNMLHIYRRPLTWIASAPGSDLIHEQSNFLNNHITDKMRWVIVASAEKIFRDTF